MSNSTVVQEMLYRTLGSTGENVSAIGIGGWHKGGSDQVPVVHVPYHPAPDGRLLCCSNARIGLDQHSRGISV